jgi:hypothetical protein
MDGETGSSIMEMIYGITPESKARDALVAKLSKDILAQCRGHSVMVTKAALEKATRDCEISSVVVDRA